MKGGTKIARSEGPGQYFVGGRRRAGSKYRDPGYRDAGYRDGGEAFDAEADAREAVGVGKDDQVLVVAVIEEFVGGFVALEGV